MNHEDSLLETRDRPRFDPAALTKLLSLGRTRPTADELEPRWIAGPPKDGGRP